MSSQVVQKSTLRIVDPVTSPAWEELVSGPDSSLFHSPRWMGVIQDTYGLPISACVVEDPGPVAGIAWAETGELLGSDLVTLPFSDHCGPISQDPADTEALISHMVGLGQPWKLATLARSLEGVKPSGAVSRRFKLQTIDLAPDTSALWEDLSSMTRRAVRKAKRSGLVIQRATDKGQLRDFYLLHMRLRKSKFGLLAQPYAFFEKIWDAFVEPGQGFLLLALYGELIVAGTFYLLWKDSCYYKFNASDTDHLLLRPNNLLLWQGILDAKDRGCRVLDLGRTDHQQDGLLAFKRSFGASEEDLYFLNYNAGESRTEHTDEARRLLQELTRLFVKESVPDSVTEDAGALLYRYLV